MNMAAGESQGADSASSDIQAMLPTKPLFSVREVCQLLGVGRTVLYTEIEAGRLKCKRVGKVRLGILRSSLVEYLQSTDAVASSRRHG